MANAGTVEVDVLGNWQKFVDSARNVGGQIGGEIQRGVDDGIDKGAAKGGRSLRGHGERGGREYGSAFSSGFGSKVTTFMGAYFGARFFQGVVNNASDLSESLSKSSVVFGDNAKDVERWADTSAKSVLLSKQAAVEAAASYGNLFSGMGLDSSQSANLSKNLVQLAADLASFNNTSVEDAMDALRSGLVGETEPLKRYGVLINETAIKEKARALGLVKDKETLSERAKLEARYALLLEQTATAQGDVARTGSGYANQLRQAQANWENLQAQLGVAVVPALAMVLSLINALDGSTLKLIVTVGAASFAFVKLVGAVNGVGSAMTFLAANPWVAIIGGIALAVLLLAKNWDTVTAAVDRFMEKVGRLADIMPGWLKPIFGIKQPAGFSKEGLWNLQQKGLVDADGNIVKRAAGGLIWPNRPTLVGERGPELMIPRGYGRIINNDQLQVAFGGGAGASSVAIDTIAVQARGDLSSYRQQDWEQVGTTIARVVTREIQRDRRSQGQ